MAKPKDKHAWVVNVGEKGEIVIPKDAREIFSITTGDTLNLLGDEQPGIAIPPKDIFTTLATKIFGEATPEVDNE